MNYTDLHARRSGRTTRMLEEAIEALVSGRAVYILCVDATSAHYIKNLYRKVCEQSKYLMASEPKFETLQSIGMENIDWKNSAIHRAHPNCKLFIDHGVYSRVYGHIINGYHECDEQMIVT